MAGTYASFQTDAEIDGARGECFCLRPLKIKSWNRK